jgi:plasmid stabilization system protein ParE
LNEYACSGAYFAVGFRICFIPHIGDLIMPRGDKDKYTDKQKRQAEHIEEGYEKRGVSKKEAEKRAWATVNKDSGGGKKSGSGRGKNVEHTAAKKGGKLGGKAAASRPASARSASAKKAAATRKRNAAAANRA